MDAAAETGRNPVSKHQIQPEYGDEQADAGRGGRTLLTRPNYFTGANVNKEISIFLDQLTRSRIGDLTRLIHTLLHGCLRDSACGLSRGGGMVGFPGARFFRAPIWCPSGGVGARERQGAPSRRAW